MDVSQLNLGFLNTIAQQMANFNQPNNKDSKVNFSALLGNKNVNVENKNVSQ